MVAMALQHDRRQPVPVTQDAALTYASPAEDSLHLLMKRCVECPPEQPSCPTCADDETCSLIPQSCGACAYTQCVKIRSIPGQTQAVSNSAPIGGIVGGVIGGVIAIVAITYLVWRFCLRGKRRQDTWVPPEKSTIGRSATLRSRTNSIASTVLTRASNVIQIAYIPGVTVRSTPETPEIPPMPTAASSYAGTSANTTPELEQHFFMPSRDSTWSDATSIASDNRISLTPSLARASVATTMYHNDAVVPPIPAQYAYQTHANMVSVRSGSSTPSIGKGAHTPPMPQVQRIQQIQAINGSQIVARNVTARPVEIKKNNSAGNNVPTLGNLAAKRNSQSRVRQTSVPSFSDEKEVVLSPSTIIDESPSYPFAMPRAGFMNSDSASISGISAVLPADSPLGSSSAAAQRRQDSGDISAMIQSAIKSATSSTVQLSHRPDLLKHDSGPFSDANEIRENNRNLI